MLIPSSCAPAAWPRRTPRRGASGGVSHCGEYTFGSGIPAILGGVRIVLIVVALAAAGWLVMEERSARATDRITRAALATPDPARLRQAERDLKTATRLNPDTTPYLDLAIAEARAGDIRKAGTRLEAVTRKEPENVRAWQLLCSVAPGYDSDLAATACARERALAPPVSLKRRSGRSTR